MSKRLCSLCLCLVLLLACLPAACFADTAVYSGAIAVTYTTPTAGDSLSEFQVSADNSVLCGKTIFLDTTDGILIDPATGTTYAPGNTEQVLERVQTVFQAGHEYTAYVTLSRADSTFEISDGTTGVPDVYFSYYKGTVTVNGESLSSRFLKPLSCNPVSVDNYAYRVNIKTMGLADPVAPYLIIHFSFTPNLQSLSVSLSVAQDLQLNYSFTNPGTYSRYQMVFTRTKASDGTADEPVSCGVTEENGKLSASYCGISPQRMTDQIQAQLQGSNDGTTWTPVAQSTCSVRDYCDALYGKPDSMGHTESQIAATRRLLADLLAYGSAAQTMQNYATSNLADADFAGNIYKTNTDPSSFAAPAPDLTRKHVEGNDDISFTGATLLLDHLNFIAFKLKVPEANIADATVQIYSGSTLLKTVSSDQFETVDGAENIYRVLTSPLYLSQNRQILTAKLYVGSDWMETVTYSVNSYISYVCAANRSETVGSLVRQLYAFGESAQAYLTAMNGGTAQ